jgi:phenylalanyl-tRNA synthetase beta chain
MFSEYAATPFQVEQVLVEYESPPTAFLGVADASGATSTRVERQTTPDLTPRVATASPVAIASTIGAAVSAGTAAALLSKMGLQASVVSGDARAAAALEAAAAGGGGGGIAATRDDAELLRVLVPPTRADVLHECDIAEDVAIAFGYNNIVRTLPKSATTGGQLPVNALTDKLRAELVAAGCDEALTLALCSRKDNYDDMLLADDGRAVILANPQRCVR